MSNDYSCAKVSLGGNIIELNEDDKAGDSLGEWGRNDIGNIMCGRKV